MSDATKMLAEQAVGQLAQTSPVTVTAEEIVAFAEATSDDNARFCDATHADFQAPPIFSARYFNPLYLRVLAGARADFRRLVFGEMDYRYLRPLRPGIELAAEVETTALEEKSSGQLLRARARAKAADDGTLLLEGVATFFVRAPRNKEQAARREQPVEREAPPAARVVILETRPDQAQLFAKVANDPNPIHLDDRLAKAAGLGGVIMHGLCTMAFCGRAALSTLCGDDPARLGRLAVRFSKPARPGEPLTIRLFAPIVPLEPGTTHFVAENDAGQPVITGGLAEIR